MDVYRIVAQHRKGSEDGKTAAFRMWERENQSNLNATWAYLGVRLWTG